MNVEKTQIMNDSGDYIQEFLAHMGVKAEVRMDSRNQKVVVIETEQFLQRRAWIETWFTLVDQVGSYSYFHERARGTGQTV
jgi:hypothetical protein